MARKPYARDLGDAGYAQLLRITLVRIGSTCQSLVTAMPSREDVHGLTSSPTSDKAAALALTPVSRETEARLDRYVDLLLEWQAKTNLVAPSTLPNLWTRHISDSLQLLTLAPIGQDLGRSRQRRRLSRRGAGLRVGGNARARWSIWSSATPRRPPSCARRCGSPTHRAPFTWLTSGIMWIESQAASIASPRGRWLRYTNSSASRNRW